MSAPNPVTVTDADSIELWGTIFKGVELTNKRLHGALRAAFSLNEAEVDSMVLLGSDPDRRSSMAALARSASFTSGGYTKVADRLVARGLVTRTSFPEDRRMVYLELTPAGAEMAAEVRCLIADINRRHVFEVLGEEQVRAVAAAMDLLRAANAS
jgi:DNA-binding MarR family transcriptional regulator